jgi:hypothetical protein
MEKLMATKGLVVLRYGISSASFYYFLSVSLNAEKAFATKILLLYFLWL